jgi:hypothetical protein
LPGKARLTNTALRRRASGEDQHVWGKPLRLLLERLCPRGSEFRVEPNREDGGYGISPRASPERDRGGLRGPVEAGTCSAGRRRGSGLRLAEEVELLAEVAGRYSVPLVALGAGLEGRWVLIHFDLMRSLRLPEHEEPWVEAEPGASWLQLDDHLRARGWSLAVYPTSAPRATVGGWLTTDGLGVGSFEYGWLSENVLSVSLVLPGGERREVPGEDLRSFVAPESGGAVIVGAKLRTRRADADVPFGATCGSAEQLVGAVVDAAEAHRAWGERFFPVAPSHPTPSPAREFVHLSELPEALAQAESRPPRAAVQGTVARGGGSVAPRDRRPRRRSGAVTCARPFPVPGAAGAQPQERQVPPGMGRGVRGRSSPDAIAEMVARIYRHREGGSPFEVAVAGYTEPGDDALPRAYEEAGVTWWLESVHGMRGDLDQMVARTSRPSGVRRATEQGAENRRKEAVHR